ncbi:MAG TPA: folylpolyglutamate synthase/dihydrofolate synthase family protein [Bryobacteraceae bacterium]|nr:folylpolyglutamate synthase/dihydrofolate synthase family protein [Bryobacteraceae bacterium]
MAPFPDDADDTEKDGPNGAELSVCDHFCTLTGAINYPDSVEFLYKLGNEIATAKLGLERIRTLLAELGNPECAFRVIHVAGTNGKGSTCAMIEAALRTAGHHTGLYTSPHLVDPTERIQINAQPVTPEQFAAAFNKVHAVAERTPPHPTYFETVTAMGFLIFREAGVHVAVVEVGLGGRLDATNVVQPEVTVITPVDFDHERFLGSSIEQIAAEKAGILKPRVPAVFAAQRPEADRVLTARAAELGLRVIRSSAVRELPVRPPLAGRHQIENARTAVATLTLLGVDARGIANARWPGRLEQVASRPDIILDGAHNPAGARALAEHIREQYGARPVWIVFGAMRDKAVSEIGEILFPLADRVILTAPAQARAVHPQALQLEGVTMAPNVAAAIELARSAPSGAAVFITGSLYLVGEARAILVK